MYFWASESIRLALLLVDRMLELVELGLDALGGLVAHGLEGFGQAVQVVINRLAAVGDMALASFRPVSTIVAIALSTAVMRCDVVLAGLARRRR